MPDSMPLGDPSAHLSVSLAAAVGRLGRSWDCGACPSPAPANGMLPLTARERERRDPRAPAQRLASKWECYAAASATAGGSPSTPPPCQPATHPLTSLSLPLPLSSNSCSLAALSGSLAALVPDPCVARSLVSNLPGPPKPSQTSPPSAAPSFPCPPGGSTRLHAGQPGHMPPPTTTGDGARRGAGPGLCAHEHTHEGTDKQTNEQASHRHTHSHERVDG